MDQAVSGGSECRQSRKDNDGGDHQAGRIGRAACGYHGPQATTGKPGSRPAIGKGIVFGQHGLDPVLLPGGRDPPQGSQRRDR